MEIFRNIENFFIHIFYNIRINHFKVRLNNIIITAKLRKHIRSLQLFRWHEKKQTFFQQIRRLPGLINKNKPNQRGNFHSLYTNLRLNKLMFNLFGKFSLNKRLYLCIFAIILNLLPLLNNRAKQIHIDNLLSKIYAITSLIHPFSFINRN